MNSEGAFHDYNKCPDLVVHCTQEAMVYGEIVDMFANIRPNACNFTR